MKLATLAEGCAESENEAEAGFRRSFAETAFTEDKLGPGITVSVPRTGAVVGAGPLGGEDGSGIATVGVTAVGLLGFV